MHWLLICLGAVPLLAYLIGRWDRRGAVASPTHGATPPASVRGRMARAFHSLMILLALPFLLRVAVTALTILGLVYVLFFGPIRPVHEWLH